MRNHDGVTFPALYFLLRECNLLQRTADTQDRALLDLVLARVCHPDLLTVNRYRFSDSSDYFVPNKTIYADYLAFIRELPSVEDHMAFNVTPNSWRRRQERLAVQLVDQLTAASKFLRAEIVQDAAAECRAVLKGLPQEASPLVEALKQVGQVVGCNYCTPYLQVNESLGGVTGAGEKLTGLAR